MPVLDACAGMGGEFIYRVFILVRSLDYLCIIVRVMKERYGMVWYERVGIISDR